MKKILLSFLVILSFNFSSYSQKEDFVPPNFIPPSPTAFELGVYGYANVGMHTGTANTSIPLYNYTAGKISVPITLSYSSNGIKVDQLSSNVGLGWSLNAGGVITRIVMGKSDENNELLWPQDDINQWGTWSPTASDFFYSIGNNQNIDAEPDQYAYNFNGYTGKFAYTKEHDLILMPHRDIKIEPYVDGLETGFMATTPDGVKYIFLDQEINMNRSVSVGRIPPGPPSTTAWFLSEIIHPDGDSVEFVYGSQNYSYYVGISESLKIPSPAIQKKDCDTWTNASMYVVDSVKSKLTIVGKKLTQIKSKNALDGKVDILHTMTHPAISSYDIVSQIKASDASNKVIEKINFEYLSTANDRLFLSSIQFNDPAKKYEFDYFNPQNLPVRLNFGQDHWGYANGASNTHKFPNPSLMDDYLIHADFRKFNIGGNREIDTIQSQNGLLKKIVYPTGGYTEMTYESNSYYGEKTVYPASITSYLSIDTDENDMTGGSDSTTITNIQSDQEVDFYASVGFNDYETNCDYNTYPTHHILASIKVTNISTSQTNTIYKRNYVLGDEPKGTSINITPEDFKSDYFFKFKANNNYQIELKVIRTCLTAGMNFTYFQGTIQKVDDNIKLGGSRVKKVSIYDPVSNNTETKRYYYSNKESLNISSGHPGIQPFYVSDAETQIACSSYYNGYSTLNTTYKLLNSASTRPLSNPASGIVSYNFVTVSHGGDNFENGGEEHEFITGYDYPGNPLIGEYIQSAPWTNAGWNNGLEKKLSIFKKEVSNNNFITLKETISEYKEDGRLFDAIKGYSVVKKYDMIASRAITYECTLADINKTYYYYDKDGDIIYSQDHKCKGKNVGEIVSYPDQISNLDITEYENRSYWHYLESTEVKQFDANGLNPVTTTTAFFYDNENHVQLTRSELTDSKGNQVETKVYYPDDVSTTSSLPGGSISSTQLKAIDTLKLKHRINIPLQTEITNNGSLFRTRTIFKDWGQKYGSVEHLISPELVNSSKSSELLEPRLIYLDYDSYGNPLEVAKVNGTHIVYIWGYSHSKPIAKIENAKQSEFTTNQSNRIAYAITASDNDSSASLEITLRQKLEDVRQAFPDSRVETYTYDPLIGVTSMTDASGYTTYYEYDGFNRLEFVKNKDLLVLKSYDYHYQTEIPQYTISSTTNGNGTVSLSTTEVDEGQSVVVTVTPNSGYQISSITVNGIAHSISSSFTISNITSNTVVNVQFSVVAATLAVTPTSMTFQWIDSYKTATVTASGNWTVSKSASWITISATSGSGNGSFTIKPSKNNGSERYGTVTVTQSGTSKTIAILQSASDF